MDGNLFDEWLHQVDLEVQRICGLSIYDLADWHYWDAWNDGYSPHEAAQEVLANEGYPYLLLIDERR